jgi:antitoxin (DNA-binding transcriptional repressor) of toxin-antitoxin stability system
MTMLTMPSVGVQNRFGSVARIVSRGEIVTVTQYGEPTMMILPFGMAEEALRAYRAQKMLRFMDNMQPTPAGAPDVSFEDINNLVHELRN